MSLYGLRDSELLDAYQACVAWIRTRLATGGVTYASLAAEIGVGESALKQFVRRAAASEAEGSGAPLRRGAAFERIYEHYQSERAGRVANHTKSVPDDQRTLFYQNLQMMIGVKPDSNRIAAEKVFENGPYLCFRNGTIGSEFIVISEITFHQLSKSADYGSVWEFSHSYDDNDGMRTSEGVAFALHKCLYLIGDIEYGQGLEIFRILEPQKSGSLFLVAFVESINDGWEPFVANAIIIPYRDRNVRAVSEDGSLLPVSPGVKPKDYVKKLYHDRFEDFGQKLIDQLNIGRSENVLKLRRSFLFPEKRHEDVRSSVSN